MDIKESLVKFVNSGKKLALPYKDITPSDNHTLIKVFYWQPKKALTKSGKEVKILGLDGENVSTKRHEQIVPYAIILKVGTTVLETWKDKKEGDIVCLSDALSQVQENPDWRAYQEIKNERPAPRMQEPPRFIGAISRLAPMKFDLDKLNPDEDDFVFMVPQAIITGFVTKEFFNKYKVEKTVKLS